MGIRLTRYINAFRAGYSFLYSSLAHRAKVSGMPLALGVELTNTCNLACPECTTGSGLMTRPKGFMDIDLFSRVITELRPGLLNLNLYFQGEPMLHPGFFSFLKRSMGIHTTVSTNGHFINRENARKLVRSGLGKLIISLDGMDRETYSLYRKNGDLDNVVAGIEMINEERKRENSGLKVELQFLVNRHNQHQTADAKKFSERNGMSLRFKSMQVINPENHELWLPSAVKYSRYIKRSGVYQIRNPLPDRCARLWFNPVITWDGKVIPCCFDKDADHIMGDLNEDSFSDIWNGPRYRLFRRTVLTDRGSIAICRNCTSGMSGVSV